MKTQMNIVYMLHRTLLSLPDSHQSSMNNDKNERLKFHEELLTSILAHTADYISC